jgi:type II secretory pathway component PulK
MAGRFNLNNLVTPQGTRNEFAFAWFQRLLARLQLEPKWAALLQDWIDPDNVTNGADGAEDGVYLGMNPPYRPPNRPISTTSELLSLPGFGIERIAAWRVRVGATDRHTLATCVRPLASCWTPWRPRCPPSRRTRAC